MKKLGKKVVETGGSLSAYACYCPCGCSQPACTCKNNPSSSHRSAMYNSSQIQNSMYAMGGGFR